MVSSKRILFVHHTPGYGGAYKSLALYASALRSSGHIVKAAFYNSSSSESEDYHYCYRGRIVGLKRVMQILYLVKTVYTFKPDVIIGLMPINALFSLVLGRIFRVTVIGSERGDPYSHTGIWENIKQRFLAKCDIVIFQTVGAQKYYSRMLSGRSFVIPNCVEATLSPIEYSSKSEVVAFFGRFDLRHKRLDVLLDVFRELSAIYPDLKFDVFGGGSEKEELFVRQKCTDLQIVDRVSLCGVSNNIYHEMEKRRFYILTSDSEGMPNSLLEAMACGMVCVSTDCSPGGAAEIIDNGVNGFVVPREDVSALVNCISDVISNPELGERLSRNARERASHFSRISLKVNLDNLMSGL